MKFRAAWVCPIVAAIAFSAALARAQDEELDDAPAAPISHPTTAPSTRPSRDENPPGIVDKLVQIEDADSWSDGTLEDVNVYADAPARIELGYREAGFPRIGTWTGSQIETDFPFTELIASFNPTTPPNTGIVLEIRVEQDGVWSPWVFLQDWGRTLTPPERTTKWDAGHVSIDTLVLDKPASKYQARITLSSFDTDAKFARPAVRRLSVCYSGVVADEKKREKILKDINGPTTQSSISDDWVRDLPVPYRGQGDSKNPKAIRKLICSPTSTSMVLQYYGIDRPTLENAAAIYDPQYDMFGNWGRAVARAGELGLDGYLDRFRDWDKVHRMIARGIPVIASIRYRKGEVKGLLLESTKGHLIVIRGFKPDGNVIVNDPGRKEQGNGVIYPAAELAKAWFNHGGVGYVIEKPTTSEPTLVGEAKN